MPQKPEKVSGSWKRELWGSKGNLQHPVLNDFSVDIPSLVSQKKNYGT